LLLDEYCVLVDCAWAPNAATANPKKSAGTLRPALETERQTAEQLIIRRLHLLKIRRSKPEAPAT
jgi:hypothetical protein